MARIKVTNSNIVTLLTQWANNTNRENELVFYNEEINERDVKQRAWDLASMIIEVLPDTGGSSSIQSQGFKKIVFVDKL